MSAAKGQLAGEMLAGAFKFLGVRTAHTGNRRQRREAVRELSKTPGADWYIPPRRARGRR